MSTDEKDGRSSGETPEKIPNPPKQAKDLAKQALDRCVRL